MLRKASYIYARPGRSFKNFKISRRDIEREISKAKAKHRKSHLNHRYELYVFQAWFPDCLTLAILPVGAVSYDEAVVAFRQAVMNCNYRGECEWSELYSTE